MTWENKVKMAELLADGIVQPQPKQGWSEEDEKMLYEISQCVYNNIANIGTVNKVKYIDWLKSLKERMKGEATRKGGEE